MHTSPVHAFSPPLHDHIHHVLSWQGYGINGITLSDLARDTITITERDLGVYDNNKDDSGNPGVQINGFAVRNQTGPIPVGVDQFSYLDVVNDPLPVIDLRFNRFDLPTPAGLLARCTPNTRRGIEGCYGLPPFGCEAFGEHAVLSAMSPGTCILCPEDKVGLAITFALTTIGALVAFVVYIRMINKYPKFDGWISTSRVILGQLNVVGIFSMLKALDGSVAQSFFKYFNIAFFDVSIASPECLSDGSGGGSALNLNYYPPYGFCSADDAWSCAGSAGFLGVVNLGPTGIILFGLIALAVAVCLIFTCAMCCIGGCCGCWKRACRCCDCRPKGCCASRHGQEATEKRVDSMQDLLTTLFANVFGTCSKMWFTGLFYGGDVMYVAFILMGVQAVYSLYLLRRVCKLSGAKDRRKARLEDGLKYIVATYRQGPYDNFWHSLAPYWQFVTWARTLAIMAAPMLLKEVGALPQAAIPIAEVSFLIGLQYKCEPFPHRRQNKLELGGLIISLLTLILAVIYEVAGPMSSLVDVLIIVIFIILWAVLGGFFVLRWVGEDGHEEDKNVELPDIMITTKADDAPAQTVLATTKPDDAQTESKEEEHVAPATGAGIASVEA